MKTKSHIDNRPEDPGRTVTANESSNSCSWFLEGQLTRLRGMHENDLPALVRWLDDHRVTRYLARGTYPASLSGAHGEHQSMQASSKDVELAVTDAESGACIGVTGLHELEWIARHAEFRILIGEPTAWGRGIGTEVCQLMCCYGFEVLNLNKIYLGASEANRGAVRSYEKSGLRAEGILRQEVYRNSTYYDVVRMSLLRHEYEDVLPSWTIADKIAELFPRG